MNDKIKEFGAENGIARTLLCGVAAGGVFLVDINVSLGVAGGVPYVLPILISLSAKSRAYTLAWAAFCSVLTWLGFWWSPEGGTMWMVLSNRFLALFAIWTTAVLGIQRNAKWREELDAVDERNKALAELKVLKGLLPICSGCKKIRDDSGYWNQIETYISQHSEAEFSHGLCPDCIERLYPDIAPKIKKTSN